MSLHRQFSASARPRFLFAVVLAVLVGNTAPPAEFTLHAQSLAPGRNVNMVSGTKWPDGDPYLQRQNEPSIAASTRNPLHLLAGANDYRTVDIPNPVDGDEETGDAWLGLFKSFDGGQRWQTTLLPGYPQDTSAEGLASPLRGYQAGADPVVRAGTNGLFYYAGLVFDRGEDARSAIFISRFIDNNNQEDNYKANRQHVVGDPLTYLGTQIVARNGGRRFYDKPWVAVDIPRSGRTCAIPAPNGTVQTIPAGDVYVAFSSIDEDARGLRSEIMLTRSSDCGATWTRPARISDPDDRINQGATIAIDPRNGAVQIAWRRFASDRRGQTDGFVTVRSTDGGRRFSAPGMCRAFSRGHGRKVGLDPERYFEHRGNKKPKTGPSVDVAEAVDEFDQTTSDIDLMFRTNAYPTMAIDDSGRIYLAWSERGFSPGQPGDARIVVSTSGNGRNWTAPQPVANEGQPGHQIMPSLVFGGGRLVLAYYDLREDYSGQFTVLVDDRSAIAAARKRHTLDLRASSGTPGSVPVFGPSVRVSDYLTAFRQAPGGTLVEEQVQFNPPNLPMFKQGTSPFIGDYIDLTVAPAFVPTAGGGWAFNTNGTQPVFHAVWTDNRDVRQPGFDVNGDGNPWNDYTAPTVRSAGTPSVFDPTANMPTCTAENTGSRNQNIYTARLSMGLIVGSPGNTKPLSPIIQRAFVVFAQNTTEVTKRFRLNILGQPPGPGGRASFDQFSAAPVTELYLATPGRSTAARSVYATSSDPDAQIKVTVTEVEYNGSISPVPLSDVIILNPDIANPDIANPDIANPDIANPDIANAEVYNPDIANPDIANPDIANPDIANPAILNPDIANPDIANPDIANPDIANPDIANPDIANARVANPDIANPDIANPDIANPDIANPDIANPDIANPDIANGSLTDVTWTMTNNGNTTSAFNVNLFLAQQTDKICPPGTDPDAAGCIATQLILRKVYNTPVAVDCELKVQSQNVLLANIPNPQFVMPGQGLPSQNSDAPTNATLWLAPGETAKITLRVYDPVKTDNVNVPDSEGETGTDPGGLVIDPIFFPTTKTDFGSVTPVVQQQSVDTQDTEDGSTTPPIITPLSPPVPSGTNDPSPTPLTLAFVQQPGSGVSSSPVSGPVRVLVNDQYGQPLPGALVTLFLGTNPTAATLSDATALTAVTTGIAEFPNLTVSVDGLGYTLVATSGQALPAVSDAFGMSSPCSPLVVTTTADSGCGSLRGAILYANAMAGTDTITFNVPGAEPHVITPASPLPDINEAVVIDGTSDPHYGIDQEPVVTLDGSVAGGAGLHLVVGASTIKGLGIVRFAGQGVFVRADADNSIIEKNYIGTDRTHVPAMGNGQGVYLLYPDGVTLRQNTISGNAAEGVLIVGGTGNVIQDNYIGTVPGGLSGLGNGSNGITLYDGSMNTIVRDNLISGNGSGPLNSWGIEIQQTGALALVTGTRILHNTIGLDSTAAALPNVSGGVRVLHAPGTVIGAPGDGNVISGNDDHGDPIRRGGPGILVEGTVIPLPSIQANRIGTDPDGLAARSNLFEGIILWGPAQVGGTGADEGNLIAGNGDASIYAGTGILVGDDAGGSIIQGNVIGLNVASAALGNGYSGITMYAPSAVTVGGTDAGARNVISGNPNSGIAIYPLAASVASGIVVQGNYIGTDVNGVVGAGTGNGQFGISIEGTSSTIGGAGVGAGNLIAGNASGGVAVVGGSTEVTMTSNAIYGNGGLGIDLHNDGVTVNDPGDTDAGPNGLQNFPVINLAANLMGQANTLIDYTLDSAPGTTLQFFTGSACGSAEQLRLTTSGTTGRTVVDLGMLLGAGTWVTATATDSNGNTSEFSTCVQVTAPQVAYYDGHYYQYVTTGGLSWSAANAAASAAAFAGMPGHLVSITSGAEQTVVHALYGQMGLTDMRAWIGLFDSGTANWAWSNGDTFSYSNWGGGEPNNIGSENWVEFFASGEWNNNTDWFGGTFGYVVEYEPAP